MFQERWCLENIFKIVEQIVALLQLHALKAEYFPPPLYKTGSIYL
jgi:hypothetical protein